MSLACEAEGNSSASRAKPPGPGYPGAPAGPVTAARRRRTARSLAGAVARVWSELGRYPLIGWRPAAGGIELLFNEHRQLAEHPAELARAVGGRRRMGDEAFLASACRPGVKRALLALPGAVGEGEGQVPAALVESVVRRYAVIETRHRGVGVFDIAGFAKLGPLHQMVHLASLERSISLAHLALRKAGMPVDLALSTTGDGFYVWNRRLGLEADTACYLAVLLALADHALLAPEGRFAAAPALRTCFAVGSHFSYSNLDHLRPTDHRYIVGDVTIRLARMAEKCLPGQVLLGDFRRPAKAGAGPIDTVEFAARALAALSDRLLGCVLGRPVAATRGYLTGDRIAPDRFNVTRFAITDKHGFRHVVFNQKLNVYAKAGAGEVPLVRLGKRQAELRSFDAEGRPRTPWSLGP